MKKLFKKLTNKDEKDRRSSGRRRAHTAADPQVPQDAYGAIYHQEGVRQGAQYPTGQPYAPQGYGETPPYQNHVYSTAVPGNYGEEPRYEIPQTQSVHRRESRRGKTEDRRESRNDSGRVSRHSSRRHSRRHSRAADEEEDISEYVDYPSPSAEEFYYEPQTYTAGRNSFSADLGQDPVAGLNSGRPAMRRGAYRRDSDRYSIDDLPGSHRVSGIDPFHSDEQINLLPRAYDEPTGLPVPGRRNAISYLPQPPATGTGSGTGYADTGYGYDPTRQVAPYSGGTDPRDFVPVQRSDRHSRRHSLAGPPPAMENSRLHRSSSHHRSSSRSGRQHDRERGDEGERRSSRRSSSRSRRSPSRSRDPDRHRHHRH